MEGKHIDTCIETAWKQSVIRIFLIFYQIGIIYYSKYYIVITTMSQVKYSYLKFIYIICNDCVNVICNLKFVTTNSQLFDDISCQISATFF